MYRQIPKKTVARYKGSAESNLRTTTLVYSPRTRNEEQISQSHFVPVKPFTTARKLSSDVTDYGQMCPCVS